MFGLPTIIYLREIYFIYNLFCYKTLNKLSLSEPAYYIQTPPPPIFLPNWVNSYFFHVVKFSDIISAHTKILTPMSKNESTVPQLPNQRFAT